MRKVQAVSLGAFLAGAVLAVCGCDDGGSTRDADVTGQWTLVMTVAGSPSDPVTFTVNPGVSPIEADIEGDPVDVTVSGSTITIYMEEEDAGTRIVLSMTGTLSGTEMVGTLTIEMSVDGVPVLTMSGTWDAQLVTPALVDVSGDWNIDWEYEGDWGQATATLTEDAGSISGTYDPDYGLEGPVIGSIHGYDLTLTVVETSPFDRTVTVVATVNAAGTSATGSWSDTDGDSGDWDAARP